MNELRALRLGAMEDTAPIEIKLNTPPAVFPAEILDLGDSLIFLDLSGSLLSSLPSNFGPSFPRFKSASFVNCCFNNFPPELSSCPSLVTVDFDSNGMDTIPPNALSRSIVNVFLADTASNCCLKTLGGVSI